MPDDRTSATKEADLGADRRRHGVSPFLSDFAPVAPCLHAVFLSAPTAGLDLEHLHVFRPDRPPLPGLILAPEPCDSLTVSSAGYPLAIAVGRDPAVCGKAIAGLFPVFSAWDPATNPPREHREARTSPDAAFRAARRIFRLSRSLGSAQDTIMREPETLLAQPMPDGAIELHGTAPRWHKESAATIARAIGLAPEKVRIAENRHRVPGLYRESDAAEARCIALAKAALRTGMPVIWQAPARMEAPAAPAFLVIDAVLGDSGLPKAVKLYLSASARRPDAAAARLKDAAKRFLAGVPPAFEQASATVAANAESVSEALIEEATNAAAAALRALIEEQDDEQLPIRQNQRWRALAADAPAPPLAADPVRIRAERFRELALPAASLRRQLLDPASVAKLFADFEPFDENGEAAGRAIHGTAALPLGAVAAPVWISVRPGHADDAGPIEHHVLAVSESLALSLDLRFDIRSMETQTARVGLTLDAWAGGATARRHGGDWPSIARMIGQSLLDAILDTDTDETSRGTFGRLFRRRRHP